MKIVKISTGNPGKKIIQRQFPEPNFRWGDCKFYIDTNIKDCDWWFICHVSGLQTVEVVNCDPDKIVYISMEPDEIISGARNNFLVQFGLLVCCDSNLTFKNILYKNIHTWWVGLLVKVINGNHSFKNKNILSYVDLKNNTFSKKINKISVIVSSKSTLQGHKLRDQFIEAISNHKVSKYIDIFGQGYREFEDKLDVIKPYKYHIVIENSSKKYYWSEKLADAYLGGALPIYYGCTNIYDYFDENMIEVINIKNINSSLDYLLEIVEGNLYEKKKIYINQAKRKILNDYNIFNEIAKISNLKSTNKKKNKMYPNYFYIDGFIKRNIKNIYRKLF